jgi:hypothetical protein
MNRITLAAVGGRTAFVATGTTGVATSTPPHLMVAEQQAAPSLTEWTTSELPAVPGL